MTIFTCPLCQEEYIFLSEICQRCRRIRHYMNIYSTDKVHEILDNVLSRENDKINNKVKFEIAKDISEKEKQLRKNSGDYDKPPIASDEELQKMKILLKKV